MILCCRALPYGSTVFVSASRLKGDLAVVALDLGARCASGARSGKRERERERERGRGVVCVSACDQGGAELVADFLL